MEFHMTLLSPPQSFQLRLPLFDWQVIATFTSPSDYLQQKTNKTYVQYISVYIMCMYICIYIFIYHVYLYTKKRVDWAHIAHLSHSGSTLQQCLADDHFGSSPLVRQRARKAQLEPTAKGRHGNPRGLPQFTWKSLVNLDVLARLSWPTLSIASEVAPELKMRAFPGSDSLLYSGTLRETTSILVPKVHPNPPPEIPMFKKLSDLPVPGTIYVWLKPGMPKLTTHHLGAAPVDIKRIFLSNFNNQPPGKQLILREYVWGTCFMHFQYLCLFLFLLYCLMFCSVIFRSEFFFITLAKKTPPWKLASTYKSITWKLEISKHKTRSQNFRWHAIRHPWALQTASKRTA